MTTQRPIQEDLEKAIEIYKKFAPSAKEIPEDAEGAKRVIAAAGTDLVPESIRPYASAELAAEYLIAAQKQSGEGNHAAARVYTAIAMRYLKDAGVDPKDLTPDAEDKEELGNYISNLFKKIEPQEGGQ